ncbi:hypothetical protein HD806DRAFT_505697 [Xylariaceae sp. AK1471]|nr:hypothetical protein HD806DRAFT_505697 [Xylariaceae sp. AK1471]
MPSSRDTVLQTAELLEGILGQLEIRTLLTSTQLVNRRWRELITQSPTLQQALYFKPIAPTSGPARKNPLLANVFPLWFQEYDKQASDKFPQLCRMTDFQKLPMADKSRRETFMHPNATWRRMLVQQPPALRLGRWRLWHMMDGDSHDFQILEFPDGLRMDSLYDGAQSWAWTPYTDFCVVWDPSVVSSHINPWYGRGVDSTEREKLVTFAEEADLVLCCFGTIQCMGMWTERGARFRKAFTYSPAKRLEEEKEDEQERYDRGDESSGYSE